MCLRDKSLSFVLCVFLEAKHKCFRFLCVCLRGQAQDVFFERRSQNVLFVQAKPACFVCEPARAQMFMCLFERQSTTFQNKTKTPREILRTTATS